MIHAPAQLPFAPRPISTELLSSWLLRVAGANLISLRELLDGLESRYGAVLTNVPIDYEVPEAAVTALSQFCRVAPRTIRMLDIRQQAPNLTEAMLLGFRHGGLPCPRYSSHRPAYAFCPSCIADQRVIHVPWEWSVSCLSRCGIHRRLLLQGCPACREPDPLAFSGPDSSGSASCQSCGGNLGDDSVDAPADIEAEGVSQSVEDACRAALVGSTPILLPKTTAREFLLFVEGMLQLLTRSLNGGSVHRHGSGSFSRQDLLAIIAALVLNAAPHPHRSFRRRRAAHSLRLWATLLSIIPEREGAVLEQTSIRWPVALRRHFLSGLHYRTRKRWPYQPYRAATHSDKPVNRIEVAVAFGLPARMESPNYVRVLNAVGGWPSGI